MRALQQTSLNGPQDLRLITDAPVPAPGPGEVLIRVTAAGVNRDRLGDRKVSHPFADPERVRCPALILSANAPGLGIPLAGCGLG
jgi:hypothetical protein